MDTIYKHKDLWQANYDDVAFDFFASDPGEDNVVVEGTDLSFGPPSSFDPASVEVVRDFVQANSMNRSIHHCTKRVGQFVEKTTLALKQWNSDTVRYEFAIYQ